MFVCFFFVLRHNWRGWNVIKCLPVYLREMQVGHGNNTFESDWRRNWKLDSWVVFLFLRLVFSCFDRCLVDKITQKHGPGHFEFWAKCGRRKVIRSCEKPNHALSAYKVYIYAKSPIVYGFLAGAFNAILMLVGFFFSSLHFMLLISLLISDRFFYDWELIKMGTQISTSTKDKDILENITHLKFIFHTQRSNCLQKLTNYGCAGNGSSLNKSKLWTGSTLPNWPTSMDVKTRNQIDKINLGERGRTQNQFESSWQRQYRFYMDTYVLDWDM